MEIFKMSKTKTVKLKPFEKVLTVMISGKPVMKEELDALLGHEIYMYRISTYMWHIKTIANGVVKVVKDGRKVAGYQLMNVEEVKEYMKRAGVMTYTPSAKVKSVTKLADLKAAELTDAQVEDIVTKAEVSELTVTEVTE
jgi:hypothetical protein